MRGVRVLCALLILTALAETVCKVSESALQLTYQSRIKALELRHAVHLLVEVTVARESAAVALSTARPYNARTANVEDSSGMTLWKRPLKHGSLQSLSSLS